MPGFEVVVHQAPRYIPNSGPKLLPVSLLLPNDKDGKILSFMPGSDKTKPQYVVGIDDRPEAKIRVQPQNILDWVSARTLENYEYDQYKKKMAMGKQMREMEMRKREERLQRKRALNEELARAQGRQLQRPGQTGKYGEQAAPKRRGRPLGWRKYPLNKPTAPPVLPDAGETSEDELALKKSTPRKQGLQFLVAIPSASSTPRRTRGLAEPVVVHSTSSEEDDEDEALEDELTAQLMGGMPSLGQVVNESSSRIVLPRRGPGSVSPKAGMQDESQQKFRPSSQQRPLAWETAENTSSHESNTPPTKRRRIESSQGSDDSLHTFNDISQGRSRGRTPQHSGITRSPDKQGSRRGMPVRERPSVRPSSAAVSSLSPTRSPQRRPKDTTQSKHSQRWEVKGILDHRIERKPAGAASTSTAASTTAPSTSYLVEWRGDFAPTWEPEENLTLEMRYRYHQDRQTTERERLGRDVQLHLASGASGDV